MEEVRKRFLLFFNLYVSNRLSRIKKDIQNAAVLVPLFYKGDSLHVILTQRTDTLTSHKGQVAFPGGKNDPEDEDLIATALREANEEIGLPSHNVDVVTQLSPVPTAGNVLLIHPIISFVDTNFDVKLSQSEVDSVFSAPLETFLSDNDHQMEKIDYNNRKAIMHTFNYYDPVNRRQYKIWGLTAGMLVQISIIALHREPDYVGKLGLNKHWLTLPSDKN